MRGLKMALFEETAAMLLSRKNDFNIVYGERGERIVCSRDGKTEMRFSGGSVRFLRREICRAELEAEEAVLCLNALNRAHPFCNLFLRGDAVEQSYLIPDEAITDAAALCELFEYHELLSQRVSDFFSNYAGKGGECDASAAN